MTLETLHRLLVSRKPTVTITFAEPLPDEDIGILVLLKWDTELVREAENEYQYIFRYTG